MIQSIDRDFMAMSAIVELCIYMIWEILLTALVFLMKKFWKVKDIQESLTEQKKIIWSLPIDRRSYENK